MRGKNETFRSRVCLSVGRDRRDYEQGWQAVPIFFERCRVQPSDALGRRKPQSSVGGLHQRGLGQYFSREPGKAIELIKAFSGNRRTRVAQPILQLGGGNV